MKNLGTVGIAALAVFLLLAHCGAVYGQNPSQSKVAGFISATGGNFSVTFPNVGPAGQAMGADVGFEDVYGSKNGLSYGAEGGLGLGDIGLFGVVKYRLWKKSGTPVTIGEITFKGDTEWSQSFFAVGVRYFLVKQTRRDKPFLPFFGGGIITSSAKESIKGEASYYGESEYYDVDADIDGTGFYLEGGADFFVAPSISLRAMIEYAKLNLGMSASGIRAEIEGGGGLFVGIALSAFFGMPMKDL